MAGTVRNTGGSLIGEEKLKQMYATMLRCRLLTEQTRHSLQPPPQSASLYHASLGQEAMATGFVIDLHPEDTIALSPRNSIAALVKGVALSEIVAQLYARRSPAAAPAREQLTVANRVALVNQQKNNAKVVVSFTRAAATEENSWHEALQFAARQSLPIIFVVENNRWEGSKTSNHPESVTRKPQIHGLTSFTVDGNDVVAVYRVACESLERVRQGGGPVLAEGTIYRTEGQELSPTDSDPLTHMEQYLRAKGLFSSRWKNQIVQRFSRELDSAMRQLDLRPTRYLRASHALAND